MVIVRSFIIKKQDKDYSFSLKFSEKVNSDLQYFIRPFNIDPCIAYFRKYFDRNYKSNRLTSES